MSSNHRRGLQTGHLGLQAVVLASAALVGCQETATMRGAPSITQPPVAITAMGGAGTVAAANPANAAGAGSVAPNQGGNAGITAGAMVPVTPVTCGAKLCMPAAFAPAPDGSDFTAPCCADSAMGLCGFMSLSGTICLVPPAVDPDCPQGPMGQKGCCLPDGKLCGIDATAYGSPGCFDNVNTLSLDLGARPKPTQCDGSLWSPGSTPQGQAGGSGNGAKAGAGSAGTGGHG